MKQEDKDYCVDNYKRILGVLPEASHKSFDTDLSEDSLENKLKEFIKKYPNDGELGGKIREFIYNL